VWWLVVGLGIGVVALGLLSTGRWAAGTAARTALLFDDVDQAGTNAVRTRRRP
jgi:hypothetical protein